MNIEKISISQIDQIEPLWNELKNHHQQRTIDFTQHYLQTDFESRKSELLEKEWVSIYIARLNKKDIGFCIASVNKNLGVIDSLYVNPKQRNAQVGKKLMSVAMEWLNQHPIKDIQLSVGQGNEDALTFYESLGFRVRATVMEFMP